jgi:hypothetical protein
MIRFILETSFVLFLVGAWGALWYEESWQPPLVPVDAEIHAKTVVFKKFQSNRNKYRDHNFIEFETNGEQKRIELPKQACCYLKKLAELKPGSQIELSWSNDNGIDYLNIEGGEAEITPRKMWDRYRDDWGMRWFLIIFWLLFAGWCGNIWYKGSLKPYLTLRSSGTAQKRAAP